MRGGNKLQHNCQCRHLHSVYCLCGWNTEKYDLYNNGKHRMYCLYSGLHVQCHNKCCDLYNLCRCVCRWNNLSVHSLYPNNK
jgi:hypothetical protein